VHSFLNRLFGRRRTAAANPSETGGHAESGAYWTAGHRVPRDWRVTAPITLPQEDDNGLALELQPGTSLRYNGSKSFSDYWNGASFWCKRRFLVMDGEHQGQTVTHIEWTYGDTADAIVRDAFPPAELEARRTPVSEVEIDETIAEAQAVAKTRPAASGHEPWDAAESVRGDFDNLLWRLAHDAPRRAEIVAAKRRLEQAMFEDIRDGNPAQP
jgi:hypothetical protein